MCCKQKVIAMIGTTVCLGLLAALLAKPHVVFASDIHPHPLDNVCKSWPMPTGYVVVNASSSQNCSGTGGDLQLNVSLPAEGMNVCNNLSIPLPYMLTTLAQSNKCGGLWDEGIIRNAVAGLSICANGQSPLPDGFAVTSASNNDKSTCSGLDIYKLDQAAPGVAICSFSNAPSGFVIDHVTTSNQCMGFKVRVLKAVAQNVSGCSFSPTPDGYVVTAGAQTTQCVDDDISQTGDYWTYTQVYDGVNVCPYSPVPSGFYITGNVTKTNCYGATYGYVLKKLQ